MPYYFIICRSLTYAQRTATALERAGISAQIFRSPKSLAGEGCSYVVKIAQKHLTKGLQVLHQAGLDPKRVFVFNSDGRYQEVAF